MLDPKILKWFQNLQIDLKRNFDLDTTKKEDIGRVRLCRITHQLRPNGKKLVVPLHEIPAQVKDENGHVIPYGVTPVYAFMESGTNGEPYEVPMPEDDEARNLWMVEQQTTFNVREKSDGRLTIESDLTDDQLQAIYDNAQDGRLYVTKPGGSINAQDNYPIFVSVSQDFTEPCFLPLCYTKTTDAPQKYFKSFYSRHRDLLSKNVGDKQARTLMTLETTDYAKTQDPEYLLNRVESLQETMKGDATNEATIARTTHESYYWEALHKGLSPMNSKDYWFFLMEFPALLSGELELDSDYAGGDGLENYYIRGENGELTPLFGDRDHLRAQMAQYPFETSEEIRSRLAGALDGGGLYVHGPKNSDPDASSTAFLRRGADGKAELTRLDQPKPKAASLWQKILHLIFRFPYRTECAREEMLESLFRTAEDDRTRMAALRETFPPVQEAPTEAPKQTALTEDEFRQKLAAGILKACRSSSSAEIVYQFSDVTEEALLHSEKFGQYMETDAVKEAVSKAKRGEKVLFANLGREYLPFNPNRPQGEQPADPDAQPVNPNVQPVTEEKKDKEAALSC